MEITSCALWSLIHGMGFGGLYLLACSGAIVELWRRYSPSSPAAVTAADQTFLRVYLIELATLAWLAVLTGAYVVYPWYRAAPRPGAVDLSSFPQRLLLTSPSTAAWNSFGMEWEGTSPGWRLFPSQWLSWSATGATSGIFPSFATPFCVSSWSHF